MCFINTPNLGLDITALTREREQGGSREGAALPQGNGPGGAHGLVDPKLVSGAQTRGSISISIKTLKNGDVFEPSAFVGSIYWFSVLRL